ncbi:hypothetical protein TKK_0019539 [Trichogramma kaykai]|uniref:Protein CDV3 homolog n=1 Tax=Trichogramma kaykai TaxID=54128 RepID=A0ABD2VSC2_9HYME
MADLDDFFAKKDKKKAKGKKFTTTEEIAKKLEETGKKIEKPKLKEKPINPESGDDNQQIEEEDEWKEFEEEKKDYTGLKIGNLTVTEGPDDDGDNEKGTGNNSSDAESGEPGFKHSGPWKKTDAPQEVVQPAAKTVGSYKPPAIRNSQQTIDRPVIRPGRGRNVAPDINSEEYFPTLNSKQPTANDSGAWGRKKRDEGSFEEVKVRGAGRTYNAAEVQSQAPKLSLGNKYGALPEDQS